MKKDLVVSEGENVVDLKNEMDLFKSWLKREKIGYEEEHSPEWGSTIKISMTPTSPATVERGYIGFMSTLTFKEGKFVNIEADE